MLLDPAPIGHLSLAHLLFYSLKWWVKSKSLEQEIQITVSSSPSIYCLREKKKKSHGEWTINARSLRESLFVKRALQWYFFSRTTSWILTCLHITQYSKCFVAETFEEIKKAMKKSVQLKAELSAKERNLVSVGYKNVISARRASLEILSSIVQKEESKGNEENVKKLKNYRNKVEDELAKICNDILSVINKQLIPSSTTVDSSVLFYNMWAKMCCCGAWGRKSVALFWLYFMFFPGWQTSVLMLKARKLLISLLMHIRSLAHVCFCALSSEQNKLNNMFCVLVMAMLVVVTAAETGLVPTVPAIHDFELDFCFLKLSWKVPLLTCIHMII